MPKNNNSASRIVKLLQSIPHHPDNTNTLEVWAELFGIKDLTAQKQSHVAAERLGAVNRELELVRLQMAEQNFSEELFGPSVVRLENACSTMILSATWNQVRQYLTSEVFVVMSFCGEIIPDEEQLISPDKLSEIATRLEQLGDSLSTSQLPPRLRNLIQHHIALIRRALEEYPICGAKGFRRATQSGLGEVWEVREEVRRHCNAPELEALGALWQDVRYETDVAFSSGTVTPAGHLSWSIFDAIQPRAIPAPPTTKA